MFHAKTQIEFLIYNLIYVRNNHNPSYFLKMAAEPKVLSFKSSNTKSNTKKGKSNISTYRMGPEYAEVKYKLDGNDTITIIRKDDESIEVIITKIPSAIQECHFYNTIGGCTKTDCKRRHVNHVKTPCNNGPNCKHGLMCTYGHTEDEIAIFRVKKGDLDNEK